MYIFDTSGKRHNVPINRIRTIEQDPENHTLKVNYRDGFSDTIEFGSGCGLADAVSAISYEKVRLAELRERGGLKNYLC